MTGPAGYNGCEQPSAEVCAMKTITLRSRIGDDGRLRLDVPTGLSDGEVEVVVVVQPVPADAPDNGGRVVASEADDWPPDFFIRTAGALQGAPLERAPQGPYDEREPLK
jgi:hypothetical protein